MPAILDAPPDSAPPSLPRRSGRASLVAHRILLVTLALVGLLPLPVALLAHTEFARRWAADVARRALAEQLDMDAHFRAKVSLLPPALVVEELVVPATDAGGDALHVERVSVRPRLFALLSGRLDAGAVEIVRPRARVVLEGGRVTNVRHRLPAAPPTSPSRPDARLPFRTLVVTGAALDVRVADAGLDLAVEGVEASFAAKAGREIVAALSVRSGAVTRAHDAGVDRDALCALSATGRLRDGVAELTDVRLEARPSRGGADAAPSCAGGAPEDAVVVAARALRLEPGEALPKLDGHLELAAPAWLLDRVTGPRAPRFFGHVALALDLHHEGRLELPSGAGTIDVSELRLVHHGATHVIVHTLAGQVALSPREARLVRATATWGGATCTIENAWIRPLDPGLPAEVELVDARGLRFPAIMRDVGVTDHTIVEWDIDAASVRNYRGHVLDPARGGPVFMGEIAGSSSAFSVSDRGFDDPTRRRVLSVGKATMRGRFGLEPDAILFRAMVADFGRSHLDVPVVTIGFEDALDIRAATGTRVDLADISPIATLPLAGVVDATVLVHGGQTHPRIDADWKARGLRVAALPLADAASGKASFVPMVLDFSRIVAEKGRSTVDVSRVRVDFGLARGLTVVADGAGKDLDVRDALAMLAFDKDPRLEDLHGTGAAKVHLSFESGTARDVCKAGIFDVYADVRLGNMLLYGERYDGGEAEVSYTFFDPDAGVNGSDVLVHAVRLRKGSGVITGSGELTRGGAVRGRFEAHDLPLSQLDALGGLAPLLDGKASVLGEIGGRVDALALSARVSLSPIRIGQGLYPESSFALTLVPERSERPAAPRRTRVCREIVEEPFDRAAYDRDEPLGVFHATGALFGGQLRLEDVTVTRQRHERVKGHVTLDGLDLGPIFQLSPAMVTSELPPGGRLTGAVTIDELETDRPEGARVTLRLDELSVRRGGAQLELAQVSGAPRELRLAGDRVAWTPLAIDVRAPSGQGGRLVVEGSVDRLSGAPSLDVTARFGPIDLAVLPAVVPRVDSASGTLSALFSAKGPLRAPDVKGELRLSDGELSVRGVPVSIEGANVVASLGDGEVRIVKGEARAGGGTLSLRGHAPLRGFELGEARLELTARSVRLPFAPGVDAMLGAEVTALIPPEVGGERAHARVSGELAIESFVYTKPIGLAMNLDALAKQRRTEVTVYDPADDFVELDLRVRAERPLVFRNNLLEARLKVEDALRLTGTNQRQGLVGTLAVVSGGRLRLRANEFDITQGTIRFEDTTRIAPHVDLRAVTDYRRYTSSTQPSAAAGATATTGARAGGSWRILLRAHGDADNVKLELSSEPQLAQDDIILLLAVGMTRAELDQLQAANLGGAAAIEALSALSGADSAVKNAIPVLDDFRLGSAYSTRTGRTEPTVQIGKRLGARIRASILTGLSESRDVRSNVEWKLTDKISILGNYDNLNDVTSEGLGNLGADFRVRVEF